MDSFQSLLALAWVEPILKKEKKDRLNKVQKTALKYSS